MVQMNNEACITNGSTKSNHRIIQDEDEETRDGMRREGQGLSEGHESRINDEVQDSNDRQMGAIQVQGRVINFSAQQRSQQQPQGHLVHWDRFLPFRSLKVLLVENDNSTRQVVSALLRNCGYEVKDVPDGKQAWKVLEDITIDVDLVLTEVVMPSLSGIGLLGKIMNNRTFKDIPVIMMSSHDSRSMVFKCLSKGAVDFLVKPIRKNKLKTLWQHVWRKYHISSGGGSESGLWNEKPTESITVEDSDNNNDSNDEDDTESIGLNFRDESDSGTRGSWTRAVDLDTRQAISPWARFADPPDSPCAQAIHPRKEAFGYNWLPEVATSTPVREDEKLDKKNMGKDLKIGMCSILSLQLEDPCEKGLTDTAAKSSELNVKKNDEQLDLGNEELKTEKTRALDLMGVSITGIDSLTESVVPNISNELSNGAFVMDKAIHENKEIPFFDVILKRPGVVQDTGTRAHDRNLLRHLDLSAFSRYNSASTANQAPTGNVGSCSPLDNNSDAAKTESVPNIQSDSNGTPRYQRSNGSSNNNDMGSTTNYVFVKQATFADKPTSKSSVKLQTSSSFQQVRNGQASLQLAIQAAGSSQCSSSNSLRAPTEGYAGNRNLNRRASGSNRRSNWHKRSIASNSRGRKIGSENGVRGKEGSIEVSGYGNNENRYVQREAALKRFRQKRQERCFEKKVRYQSRKNLAEQRPRIRGQFIRKGMHENKGKGVISYEPDSIPHIG
ncbi:hypothetical protein TIFTF001_020350 [Ficus carica]|uniref:Uncharacterized protein n=1 Tax=Ficus carica TaxID=3494 RepID=A0AA88AFM4_FICCA|nr:hypothetical protein TIFTF001_020350 [Ficus carica]